MRQKYIDEKVGVFFKFGRSSKDPSLVDINDGNGDIFWNIPEDTADKIIKAHDEFRKKLYKIFGCSDESSDKTEETWFILTLGSSPNGQCNPGYIGRTTDKSKARKHFEKLKSNPYNFGAVEIYSKYGYELATDQTNWEVL